MRKFRIIFRVLMAGVFFASCSTIEKASNHGFHSGYYTLDSGIAASKVYADVTEDKIDLHTDSDKVISKASFRTIYLKNVDSIKTAPATLIFRKHSMDIDITSILFKYRPSVHGLASQLTTEENIAIYAGWRYDNYKLSRKTNPLDKSHFKISNVGYDFGFFAGSGNTFIGPFTTNNLTTNEYNGMIMETGFAGFIESNVASFGLAVGMDYLMNSDRKIWIYNGKPWIGFIVGIALN